MYIQLFILELHQKPKLILRKNFHFSLIFVLFFTALLKTIENFELLNAPTRFTFPSNKVQLKKIKAVLLLKTVVTDTKKKIFKLKKKHTHTHTHTYTHTYTSL